MKNIVYFISYVIICDDGRYHAMDHNFFKVCITNYVMRSSLLQTKNIHTLN